MQRKALIQQIQRQIEGDYATDDSNFTDELVNQYIESGIALAAKQNYKENLQIEGIGYLNNSFYTTFKGIAVTQDEKFTWKVNLPQLPLGIGRNEGVSTLKFKDENGNLSLPCIPISENQATYFHAMRPIPNRIIYKPESGYIYAISTIILSQYTAVVTMISGGDATDLSSTLNVPNDYIPVIVEYVKTQLLLEKAQPKDLANDAVSVI